MSQPSRPSSTSVVAIVCSPEGSRTAQHASNVLAGAAAAGAESRQIDCRDGQVDDVLLTVIERADALLFAAPTYRGQAAWPLKALLDHIPRSRDRGSILRGKAAGTLLSADSAHHFLGVEPTRSILCDFFGMQVLSPNLYIPRPDPEDPAAGSRLTEQCVDYGAALVDLARWLSGSQSAGKLYPLI
jgi:multimeric flavodoxin WrbA